MLNNVTPHLNILKKVLNRQNLLRDKILVLEDKMNETLFYINRVKNSSTIKTGEFEALTTIFTGQKMYVDTRDISVAPSLMVEGYWEPEITSVFRSLIGPNDVVFDIGANFGYFGLLAGSKISEGSGSIHFFEANPDLISYILRSLSVNGLSNRSLVNNVAIADASGRSLKLNIVDGLWGSSGINVDVDELAIAGQPVNLYKTVNVNTLAIDDYCKEKSINKIDLIKMDIEGFEETAYTGMRKIIKKSPNIKLLIEFSSASYTSPQKFCERIRKDFGHLYYIDCKNKGELTEVFSWSDLTALKTSDDWDMLLAAKSPVVI